MPGRYRRSLLFVLVALLVASFMAGGFGSRQSLAQSAAPLVPAGLAETERGSRSLDTIAAGFPNPQEAAALLQLWGWQVNAYYNFAGMTASGTTSLEVSYHFFATTAGATNAMPYFATGRAVMRGLSPFSIAKVGDQLLALSGRTSDGNEATIYIRFGAILIRISAVAPAGDPRSDAATTAYGVERQLTGTDVPVAQRTDVDLLPTLGDLPAGFVVTDEGARSQAEVADTFLNPAQAADQLAAWGFEENVFRNFALAPGVAPQPGGAVSIEVSLHLFATNNGANGALPYYANGRIAALGLRSVGTYPIGTGAWVLQGPAPGGAGTEVTVYFAVSNLLVRVSAVASASPPLADALAVAWAVAAKA